MKPIKKTNLFKGTTVIRNCAAGLLFNSNYNYCDWPANVQCGSNGGSSSTTASTMAATSNVFKMLNSQSRIFKFWKFFQEIQLGKIQIYQF